MNEPTIKVARGAEVLGDYTAEQIREFLSNGSFFATDLFWNGKANEWQPLSEMMKIARCAVGGGGLNPAEIGNAKAALITKLALEIRATIGEYGLSAAERGAELNARIIEKFGDKIIPFIGDACALRKN